MSRKSHCEKCGAPITLKKHLRDLHLAACDGISRTAQERRVHRNREWRARKKEISEAVSTDQP